LTAIVTKIDKQWVDKDIDKLLKLRDLFYFFLGFLYSLTNKKDFLMIKKITITFALISPVFLLAAPTKPLTITLTALSSSSVEVAWTTADENNKGYKIFRDGKLIKRVIDGTQKTFTDIGLSADTTYNYEVKATDDETPQTVQNIVDRHNVYRNLEFSDSNLSWDEDLANHAQDWAIYLSTHYTQADSDANIAPHATIFQTDQHDEDDYNEGENIAWSSGRMPYYTETAVDISDVAVADAFPHGAVDAWASEKAYYDYATNGKKAGYENKAIGHYTQLAWQKTTRVGCAKVLSKTDIGGEWVVCRYAVQGNFNNQKPYCSNYTLSDLYSDVTDGFTTDMIEDKSFAITKVFEDRDNCTRTDRADSTLTFTGTSANIPQYDAFNAGDDSNLWNMNFDNISIDENGVLILTNDANNRYMTLKLIGKTATHYNVEAYWKIDNDERYSRRSILKLQLN
jgi:hypothetical protein